MSCFANIDLGKLKNNVVTIRKRLAKRKDADVAVCAVLKADAYGHGSRVIGAFLRNECGVNKFAVFSLSEAEILNEVQRGADILILSPLFGESLKRAISCGFCLSVSTLTYAKRVAETAKAQKTTAKAQIALDCGMNRFGFSEEDELSSFLNFAETNGHISVRGYYSHLHSCESDALAASVTRFGRLSAKVRQTYNGISGHLSSSQPFEVCGALGCDAVRIGLLLYGFRQSEDESADMADIRPIMSVYADILKVSPVKKGEYLGYGVNHIAKRDMKTAIVSFGYNDGAFRRFAENGGFTVGIGGEYCRSVGNVCMDTMTVDVTDVARKVCEGDVAEIYSDDVNAPNSVANAAKRIGTIPYELLCALGNRVERRYFR